MPLLTTLKGVLASLTLALNCVVGATAMAGTLIPAVRAWRVDPATALRVE